MHIKKDNVEYWKSLIPTIKNVKFQSHGEIESTYEFEF